MATAPKTMREQQVDSYLAGNEDYLETLYEQYLSNPDALDSTWRAYFDSLRNSSPRQTPDISPEQIKAEFLALARDNSRRMQVDSMTTGIDRTEMRTIELITAFRQLGHLNAKTDPLSLQQSLDHPLLSLAHYGFSEDELKKTINVSNYLALGQRETSLQNLYNSLQQVYCGPIGFEYMHIDRMDEVEWIRERIEKDYSNFKPTDAEKKRLLTSLVAADGLEKYLGFKYVGQKRFSLEGGDSLIPLLDTIVNQSAKDQVKEAIIGMAHRGRLNVLVNVVGKEPDAIFAAFEGTGISETHSGDVKYHLGYSSNVKTDNGGMHLVLAFNPSHLEIVAPVVQGSVRARQRRRRDSQHKQVLPIQIHGDAAFAGQGVVMETFQMSQARWFLVGGSIHIVINNQIGFTISDPEDSRSTTYPTDVAKMVQAPILHVNGDHPEAVYFAALFAIRYRQTFKRDVVIDLVCYRRHGHNEADEPSATQPLMYKAIKSLRPAYQIYAEQLVKEGVIEEGTAKKLADDYRSALDKGKHVVQVDEDNSAYEYFVKWDPFINKSWTESAKTAVPLQQLQALSQKLMTLPEGFQLQAQVKKVMEMQKRMAAGEVPLNWGVAETLAYATLLTEGYPIRLCGQDAARGTFAHRHAILHSQSNDEIYIPLSHLAANQAQINIVDSLLSEEAVLAFEYGYATAEPDFLVIWEAQFGDFANGAQVVIDQFISSGEQKWGRLCGLVMLLPHGYEGQGPEHSSARLERYLQLCAQDNMQVCIPSTPAQIFHLLRRQMIRPYRKPLIVMSPKSLLRNPLAVSPIEELTTGEFQVVIPEVDEIDPNQVDRVIFCSGKIYYELLVKRRQNKQNNIALVRIEQLYPFPESACKSAIESFGHVKDFVWCQEEPENQGAWFTMRYYLANRVLGDHQALRFVGRKPSASPAVGYHVLHEKEQEELVSTALSK